MAGKRVGTIGRRWNFEGEAWNRRKGRSEIRRKLTVEIKTIIRCKVIVIYVML